MNTPGSTPSSTTTTQPPAPRERCADACDLQRDGDRFDRLLRDKAAAHDDDDGPAMTEGIACPQPMGLPSAAPLVSTAAAAPSACGAVADAATPTQAALGASLASPNLPNPAVTGPDAPQSWQVSLHEPLGVPMELQATRMPPASPASGPATWALNIHAGSRDAATLARHALRLDERLRARALHHGHVRIEGAEDEQ